jgi:hypothetical protein
MGGAAGEVQRARERERGLHIHLRRSISRLLLHSDPLEVGLLSDGIMWSDDAIPIGAITAPHSLSPTSSTRCNATLPLRTRFRLHADDNGLTEFHTNANGGVRRRLYPGGFGCPRSPTKPREKPPTVPFGQCLSASLASFRLRDVNSASLVFVIPSEPSPHTR